MDQAALHQRARERGVNPLVYWVVRALLVPFFLLYFRLERIGREHVPADGPAIFAANHRSFLDPFIIGTLVRRPLYYVAKRELFESHPLQAWFLGALGAFPVDRGHGDAEMVATAKAILARGDSVLIFPEGTRVRPGPLGPPRRGVGRLALEAGVPVVPVSVIGTEKVRRGWRIRAHKVRARCGQAITFPRVETASPRLAQAVTDRIWPCVALQWEWLGGIAPVRRAAVIGAGTPARTMAALLTRAGLEVQPELDGVDLACFAVPSSGLLASVEARAHRLPARAGVLALSDGLAPPLAAASPGELAELLGPRPVATLSVAGSGDPVAALVPGASASLACTDRAFARQLADVLAAAGLEPESAPVRPAAVVRATRAA